VSLKGQRKSATDYTDYTVFSDTDLFFATEDTESTEGFSLTWVFSKKFSYESKLSTMIFSCPPEQLSVLFKVSEKKDKVSFDKKTCSVENRHGFHLR
jgi:hypothetical protein